MTRRRPRRGGMSSADELVHAVLNRYGVTTEVRENRIATEWRKLVGPRVAARSWPERVRDGLLYVRVSSSAWLHELSFLEEELVSRINAALGDPPMVNAIRFHLGAHQRSDSNRVANAERRQHRRKLEKRSLPPPATGADLARIEAEAASFVEDPELREAIAEARRLLNK